jgi:hypothetical protein
MNALHSSLGRRLGVAFLVMAAAAVLAPEARADGPTSRIVNKTGRDEALKFDWDISWVQISGLPNRAVQSRVNRSLANEAARARNSMRRDLREYPTEDGFGSDLSFGMHVGLLNSRLLSVSCGSSSMYSGGAHPNNAAYTITFDLRTGAKVPTRGMFRPGAATMDRIAALVDAKLRADAAADGVTGDDYFLSTVEPGDINSVVLGPNGMTFIFGDQEIGPHAAGLPEATLSFLELRGLVAADGPIATLSADTVPPARVTAAAPGLAGSVPAQ